MRISAFAAGAAVFIVVALGALAVNWFVQASAAKSFIESSINSINAQAPEPLITYEAIETSGFPGKVKISLVNPTITASLNEWLKKFAPPGKLPPQSWRETIRYQGPIIIGVNAFSNEYTLSLPATFKGSAQKDGVTIEYLNQSSIETRCTMRIDSEGVIFGSLWNLAHLTESDFALTQHIRELDCVSPPQNISDNNGTLLYSKDVARLFISHMPSEASKSMRLFVSIKDWTIQPEGDALASLYSGIWTSEYGTVPLSAYGPQNLTLDIAATMPANNAISLDQNISLTLNQLMVNNAIFNINSAFSASNQLIDDARNISFSLSSAARFTEAYEQLLFENLANTAIQWLALTPSDQRPSHLTHEAVYGVVAPAIPKLHTLGELTQQINFSYQGNAGFTNGDIQLATLKLSATPYGVSGKGSAKLSTETLLPAANLTLECKECPKLIEDVVSFAGRVQVALTQLSPGIEFPIIFNETLANNMKQFLHDIAPAKESADNNVMNFVITSDPHSGVIINGKPMMEVLMLYNQYANSLPTTGGVAAPVTLIPAVPNP